MTRQEFEKCMALLIETYTDRAYPPPRVARIWNWARKVNGKTFEQAVDAAVGDCAHAPLLSKLREHYAEISAKNPGRDKVKCDYCDGGGFILSEGIMPLAYACRCDAGICVPDYVPRWQGPWVRMVPRTDEIMRVDPKAIIAKTFSEPDAKEYKSRKWDRENQIIGERDDE